MFVCAHLSGFSCHLLCTPSVGVLPDPVHSAFVGFTERIVGASGVNGKPVADRH